MKADDTTTSSCSGSSTVCVCINKPLESDNGRAYASMASSTVVCRISARLQNLALKLNKRSPINLSWQPQSAASAGRIFRMSRLPLELCSVESMMPLHTAIASARLRSSLSMESQSWGLIPQGISMPL